MGKESEKSGGSDYFRKLFGNISKGGLGLFLNNPFQRKPESDSQQITDADMNGTFDHGGIKHEKKKGQSSEAAATEVMDDETNKHLGQAGLKIEAVSEGNENSVQRKKKTKVMRDNDENFQQRAKNIKADSENDGELDSRKDKKKANNNSDENIVPGQKKKKAENEILEGRIYNDDSSGKTKKKKKAENEVDEAKIQNDDSSGKTKKKKKVENEVDEAKIHNDDSSGKTKKKKKAENEVDEAKTHNDDSSGKTKKKKKAENEVDEAKIHNDDSSGKSKKKKEEKKFVEEKKKKAENEIPEARFHNDDRSGKTKKQKKEKNLSEERSAGEEILGSSSEYKKDSVLKEKKRKNDATDELVQTKEVKKRKEDTSEDLVQRKEEKKETTLIVENRKSEEAEPDEVQEMPERRQGKRTIEHEDINGPNKKRKISHLNSYHLEAGLDRGLTVYSGEQADQERKSQLRKRTRDMFEEEYSVRHGLQVDETPSKEGAISKKILGKRKNGDDEADMVVKKQAFDDGEKLHRTIFVGNLPLSLKRKQLIKEFSQFGEVDSVRLRSVPILDSKLPRKNAILKGQIDDSHNRVHAYVVFKDKESANAALSHNLAELGGNHIRVDRAYPPCKKLKGENHFTYEYKRTVFVGNLPFDVQDEELYQLFLGTKLLESSVEAVRVIRDPHTSKGKGIAYVLFKTMNAAKLAIKKNHFKLRDRDLRLCKAQPDSRQGSRAVSTPGSSSDMNPRTNRSSGKRSAESAGLSDHSAKKMSRISLSYQGTKASKTDGHSVKMTGAASMYSDPKQRQFQRPAVEARKTRLSKSPGPNHAGKKRKQVQARTGYSKSPKKFRAD